ncbi:MAG: hypothetical protein Q9162_007279 [Coniocarpon cinnabarinum]
MSSSFPTEETSTAAPDAPDPPPEKEDGPPKQPLTPIQRRWQNLSPLWRRVILITTPILMAIIITLIVVLVVVLRPQAEDQKRRPPIASNGQTDNATATEFSDAPFKLGLLTNFPDPSLYYDTSSRTWYAFATNQAAGILNLDRASTDLSHLSIGNIQIANSTDFVTWNLANNDSDPLPSSGNWTKQGSTDLSSLPYHDGEGDEETLTPQVHLDVPRANVWAPELLHRPSDGKWVLFYAASINVGLTHCIGAAVASTPMGPFVPVHQPLVCPREAGGAIDPAVFVDEADNNAIYLAYKVDGDIRGHGGECNNMVEPVVPTPIMLQRLKNDGITLDKTFEPIQLLDRIAEDGPLIEAPSLVKAGDFYFLFYSSGCTRYPDYTLRYAFATNIAGPYTRAEPALLKTGDFSLTAPGSASIRYAHNVPGTSLEGTSGPGSEDGAPGSWKIAVHGRINTTVGGVRALFTAGVHFDGSLVTLVDGSTSVT